VPFPAPEPQWGCFVQDAASAAIGEAINSMASISSSRLSWTEICANQRYQGRWVALDDPSYEGTSRTPQEGTVVDVDDDLAELCSRMKKANHKSCAVVFCDARRWFRNFLRA